MFAGAFFMRTGFTLVFQTSTVEAALLFFADAARVISESTAPTSSTVSPRRLDTFFTFRAVLPFPSILRWAHVAFRTVFVEGAHVSLTQRAKPVAFLFGQNNVSWSDVGEQAHRRLLPAHFSMFVKRMVVVVHLIIQHPKRRQTL